MTARFKVAPVRDWLCESGSFDFTFGDFGARRVSVEVISEGASIFLTDEGKRVLVAHGEGLLSLSLAITGAATISVVAKPQMHTSIRGDGVFPPEVGWVGAPSLTDITPNTAPRLAPEVQAMFDTLQRNMLLREERLRAEFERKAASTPPL